MDNKSAEPEVNVANTHGLSNSPPLETPHAAETPRQGSIIAALFPKDFHAKPPVYSDEDAARFPDEKEKDGLSTGSHDPDSERRESVVVDSAEVLITTVIGLEDDPSLNPWTFRAMFLGKFHHSVSKSNSLHSKASDCLALELSFRKSFTSSRRQSTSRWCS
jgi:hypothetical protein